jgi:hypothetical protein
MQWLSTFILRLLMGERYRKATQAELRKYGAFFAFLPVWGFLFRYFGHDLLRHTDAAGIWCYAMMTIVGFVLWIAVWARYVPAIVSWILGAAIWLAAFWFVMTGKF